MTFERVVLWVLGPVGSGKSTLIARGVPPPFRVVDQDVELERQALIRCLSLDSRTHDPATAAELAALRTEVADELWSHLPRWRAEGVPLAFAVTGDKPHLLQGELAEGRAAGYRNLGIALRTPLEVCLARNLARRRVLPHDVVLATFAAFEQNLQSGTYERLFEREAFTIVSDVAAFDVGEWLHSRVV
jgi:predicted kinase